MVIAPCRFAHNKTGIFTPRQRPFFRLEASSTPTARGGRRLQQSVQQTQLDKSSSDNLGRNDKGQLPQPGGSQSLPFLQEVEQRLEADLPSIGASILLAFAVVLCNYGIEGLLDIFLGDSVPGDLWCMATVRMQSGSTPDGAWPWGAGAWANNNALFPTCMRSRRVSCSASEVTQNKCFFYSAPLLGAFLSMRVQGPTLIALVRVSGIKTLFTSWNRAPNILPKGEAEPVPAPGEPAVTTPKRTVYRRRVVNDVY